MKVVFRRCAGLDVHKDVVVACTRLAEGNKVQQDVRSFETTVRGLLDMKEWLRSAQCTHVAMEATGVYWKPVWHVLEEGFDLVLANAAHIKNVPGRKSDVSDAAWIADLLAHGLIRSSFVPPEPIQQLRDLTRTRKQLVREISQHVLRIQKTLEDANIKVASVISKIMGVSGRAILKALVAGESDPQRLVACTTGQLRASPEQLSDALRGNVNAHHRFLLKVHLDQIDALERGVRDLEARLAEALAPFREHVERLKTIPGVSDIVAQTIVAEVGVDMSRFPSHRHLVSWAGLCPSMDESAGKRRTTRTRRGAPWLKTVMVQSAWGAVRTKNTYLRAQFVRLKGRRGPKKAIVAVASSILTAAFFVLRDGVEYRELGADHFDKRDKHKLANRLKMRLKGLGYEVDMRPAA
jgi:transposase